MKIVIRRKLEVAEDALKNPALVELAKSQRRTAKNQLAYMIESGVDASIEDALKAALGSLDGAEAPEEVAAS